MIPHPFRFLALALILAGALAACGAGDPVERTPGRAALTQTPAAQTAVIAVERAVVFPQPDRNAEPLTYLFEREQVIVRGQTADGTFWRVTVGDQDGWILAAQAERPPDAAPLPILLDTPAAPGAPDADRTALPTLAASPSAAAAARSTRTPEHTPTFTAFPPPDAAATTGTPGEPLTPTARAVWPGTPPPLTLDLPQGWQSAHVLLPFRTLSAIREVPLSLYEGALPGGASGHLYLFWGFPNVTSPSGEINLWTDALQILRGSLVDQSCNLGIDLEPKLYTVGAHQATGSLFSAVDCEGEPDTAGYFAALQVEGGNYAFFFAVEPPSAFADQLPTLQAILDSVRFEASAGSAP